MKLNDDELKYKNVITSLKNLPKVNAPVNFDADLMRRINTESLNQKEKESFWKKLFLPSRLIPSAALAISAVILLFFLNINNDEAENPLLMEPKVREDIIQTKNIPENDILSKDQISDEKEKASENTNQMGFRGGSGQIGGMGNNQGSLNNKTNFSIDKEGLDFRQVNLSAEDQQRLNELREHFKTLLKNSKNY